MKKLLVVLAAALATAALSVAPALAGVGGSTTWTGQGLEEGESCDIGAHWILSPAQGITSATLTVDGATYTMTQSGNGSFSADSVGPVDSSTSASAVWSGDNSTATLKLSHCL